MQPYENIRKRKERVKILYIFPEFGADDFEILIESTFNKVSFFRIATSVQMAVNQNDKRSGRYYKLDFSDMNLVYPSGVVLWENCENEGLLTWFVYQFFYQTFLIALATRGSIRLRLEQRSISP